MNTHRINIGQREERILEKSRRKEIKKVLSERNKRDERDQDGKTKVGRTSTNNDRRENS